MMPESGGQYVYVREAYGPAMAFVCGWVAFLITQSGSIAAVSVGFGIYLSYLLPRVPGVVYWAPVGVIALFTYLNYRGARTGARTQNLLTGLKVCGLVVLIASAFVHSTPAAVPHPAASTLFSLHGLTVTILGCFVAYDGWQYIAFVAGEVREPKRNLPLSLAGGTGAVILLYVLANVAYFRVLPVAAIAGTEHVAGDLAEKTMGSIGGTLIALMIMRFERRRGQRCDPDQFQALLRAGARWPVFPQGWENSPALWHSVFFHPASGDLVCAPDAERLLRDADLVCPVCHVDVSRDGRFWSADIAPQVPGTAAAVSNVGLSLHSPAVCRIRAVVRH